MLTLLRLPFLPVSRPARVSAGSAHTLLFSLELWGSAPRARQGKAPANAGADPSGLPRRAGGAGARCDRAAARSLSRDRTRGSVTFCSTALRQNRLNQLCRCLVVAGQKRGRQIGVIGKRGLHDRPVFVSLGARLARDAGEMTIALRGFEQLPADGHQPARSAAGNERGVKLPMCLLPGRAAQLRVGTVKSGGAEKTVVRDDQLLLPSLLPTLNRLTKGHPVERAACLGQIVKVGLR